MPSPDWLEGKVNQVAKSRRSEKRFAKALGGRRLPGSGNQPAGARERAKPAGERLTAGGDVDGVVFIEHKQTDAQSISIKVEWLQKICVAAARRAKDPALGVTFLRAVECPQDWVMVPREVMERLLGLR